jgi:hypothetical protein
MRGFLVRTRTVREGTGGSWRGVRVSVSAESRAPCLTTRQRTAGCVGSRQASSPRREHKHPDEQPAADCDAGSIRHGGSSASCLIDYAGTRDVVPALRRRRRVAVVPARAASTPRHTLPRSTRPFRAIRVPVGFRSEKSNAARSTCSRGRLAMPGWGWPMRDTSMSRADQSRILSATRPILSQGGVTSTSYRDRERSSSERRTPLGAARICEAAAAAINSDRAPDGRKSRGVA